MTNLEANAAVAGGKGTINIGEEVFLIDPITDQVSGTLHNYFRKTMISPLAAIMEDIKTLSVELQKHAIAEAVKIQSGGGAEMNNGFYRDKMLTADGSGFLLWMLAKGSHPELTHAKCVKLAEIKGPEVLVMELAKASGVILLGN